jgi:hypothetical protein
MELDFGLAPRELAKSCLRQRLYEMPDEQFASVKRDIGEAVQDAFKKIEQDTGMTVFELAVRELAERVKRGRCSIDEIQPWIDRIPNEWGRAELVRHLKVHFPDETWKAEPTLFRKDYRSVFEFSDCEECKKAEERHQELKGKIEAGTATYNDRLEELVLAAELDAVIVRHGDTAGYHLREREIDSVVWVLNLLLRPIMPRGKAMVPMKPHEAAVVRSGTWVHNGEEISRPGGLGALIDLASFD